MRHLRWLTIPLVACGLAGATDWPQFRGAGATGVVAKADFPLTWDDDKNVAWKTPIPGSGWAQPVVVGDKVFIATAVGDKLGKPKNFTGGVMDPRSRGGSGTEGPDIQLSWELVCLDRATGKILWQKQAAKGKPKYAIHQSNSWATETPVADSQKAIAFFGATGTLVAFDHGGKELWKQELGPKSVTNGFGTGSSPAISGDKVVIQSLTEDGGTLTCFDTTSGKEAWKVEVAKGSAWSTPIIRKAGDGMEVVCCGRGFVGAFDLATGKETWKIAKLAGSFSSSPTADDAAVYFGNSGPGMSGPLVAVPAGAKGELTIPESGKPEGFAWVKVKSGPGMPSPLVYEGHIYTIASGLLTCTDAKTGEERYKERLPGLKGISASPLGAQGRIWVLDEAGQTVAVKAGPKFEVAEKNKLAAKDEVFWAGTASTGNELFIRGTEFLYCIRK